jgi:hypothetical protein
MPARRRPTLANRSRPEHVDPKQGADGGTRPMGEDRFLAALMLIGPPPVRPHAAVRLPRNPALWRRADRHDDRDPPPTPSPEHELSIQLLSRNPALLRRLLRTKLDVPECELSAETESVRSLSTRYADLVVVGRVAREPVVACVVEVQQTRDPEKRFAWPWYATGVHAQLGCPTYLVVIALDGDVARWAAEPIETFQPGTRWAPVVIGPGDLPAMRTTRAIESEPELAVLSALAAARGPNAARRVGFVLRVLSHARQDLALAFADAAVDILSEDDWTKAMAIMEARSRRDGRPNPLAEHFESRGVREGERRVLLKLLTLRFGPPPEPAARRIAAADADTLERWAERVLTAATLDEVLAD